MLLTTSWNFCYIYVYFNYLYSDPNVFAAVDVYKAKLKLEIVF